MSDTHIMNKNRSKSLLEMIMNSVTGCNESKLMQFITEINANQNVDIVVIAGDLTAGGDLADYKYFFNSILPSIHKPTFVITGNHDMMSDISKSSKDGYKASKMFIYERTYNIGIGNYKLIMLDTCDYGKGVYILDKLSWGGYISKDNLNRFEEIIDNNRTIIVFGHTSPYYTEDPKVDAQWVFADIPERQELIKFIAEHHNIRAFISGHTHYSLTNPVSEYMTDYIVSTACAKVSDGGIQEYKIFTLSNGTITT